jgi:hypothetical protein
VRSAAKLQASATRGNRRFPWGVIVDGKGNLFGTTETGGTYNSGVAFEITP